jgi:outer membrane protein assembly factor BamC
LVREDKALGILETDWAENRAKVPLDGLRSLIGKAFDFLYSTSERDKFRTRLERTDTGGVEVYISHKGLVEVYTNPSKTQTVWQPRPVDPELEAEFLHRLMLVLGVTPEQAKELLATEVTKPQTAFQAGVVQSGTNTTSATSAAASSPRALDSGPKDAKDVKDVKDVNQAMDAIEINEPFDRAWRRVGLALDRVGFAVEDRDRSKGVYFVRYVKPAAELGHKESKGVWDRLTGKEKPALDLILQFRVQVKAQNGLTRVTVLPEENRPQDASAASVILKLLSNDLR